MWCRANSASSESFLWVLADRGTKARQQGILHISSRRPTVWLMIQWQGIYSQCWSITPCNIYDIWLAWLASQKQEGPNGSKTKLILDSSNLSSKFSSKCLIMGWKRHTVRPSDRNKDNRPRNRQSQQISAFLREQPELGSRAIRQRVKVFRTEKWKSVNQRQSRFDKLEVFHTWLPIRLRYYYMIPIIRLNSDLR